MQGRDKVSYRDIHQQGAARPVPGTCWQGNFKGYRRGFRQCCTHRRDIQAERIKGSPKAPRPDFRAHKNNEAPHHKAAYIKKKNTSKGCSQAKGSGQAQDNR
jgi:hypothetical protein